MYAPDRRYRRTVGRYLLDTSNKRTRAERVAILLTESGILYFLFFVSTFFACLLYAAGFLTAR